MKDTIFFIMSQYRRSSRHCNPNAQGDTIILICLNTAEAVDIVIKIQFIEEAMKQSLNTAEAVDIVIT